MARGLDRVLRLLGATPRAAPPPTPPPTPPPSVLELRIHGVNNTPPHTLLDLPQPAVEQVAGDDLGSFWRPTPAGQQRLRPGDLGHVPPGVVREAYSWGGLARTLPRGGSGALAVVITAIGRVGWALLTPFGLVNVAFWSRRLSPQDAAKGWQSGGQAAALRVFGVLLTLLLLGSVSVVSLDLVATQCFADGQDRCGRLPDIVRPLATWEHGQRLAALSLVPLVVLSLLVVLASVARARYEQLAAMPAALVDDCAEVERHPLATPGFWSNARLTSTLGRTHIAGGLCFMVLATAWHQVFGTGPACAEPRSVLSPRWSECWSQVFPLSRSGWPFAVTLVLALVGLVWVLAVAASSVWARASVTGSPDGPRLQRRVRVALVLCAALFVTHVLLLAFRDHTTDVEVPLLGLVGTPMLLTVSLLVIALAARRWRGPSRRAHEAWGGRAPAVFLLLALGVALTLSTLVVVGMGDWLNGDRSAAELLRPPGQPPVTGTPAAPDLMIPSVYVWFGAATFLALGVDIVIAMVALSRTSAALPSAGELPTATGQQHRPGGSVDGILAREGAPAAVLATRRWAAGAHRAEPLVRVLAEATVACASAAVLFTTAVAWWPALRPPQLDGAGSDGSTADVVYGWVVDMAAWGAALAGLAVVGGLVGGAAAGRTRPLGLLWDMVCVLPRTAHPLGPPCYAERVVPELVRRCDEWLRVDDRRRVVLSAHSLGAVLAVSSIMAVRVELGAACVGRISLLSYGTQLRVYFGRMFPELIGPDVLGTSPARGARLFTPDPWETTVAEDVASPPAGPAAPGTVRAMLTGSGGLRWVNLWRRTDYLGFPADRYAGSTVDRPAEEIDASGYLPVVATHGGYQHSLAYGQALEDLLD